MLRPITQSVVAIAIASGFASPVTWAQTYTDASYSPYTDGMQTSVTYPNTSPNAPQFHASTLQEGVLRGAASVMQAYYNGQLTLAEARILLAEARTREAQYVVTLTALAQERRQLINDEVEQLRLKQMERNLLGRQLDIARMPLRYSEYRLEPHQFDRKTGEISWPPALEHSMFADSTKELQRLFHALVAAEQSAGRFLQTQITDTCQQLQDELRKARACLKLDTNQYHQYLACQRYILGLKYEAICGGLHGSTFSLVGQ